MSNVREEIVEDKSNENEISYHEEQLDGSFSETIQPINPPTSSTRIRTERQKDHTAVSNIDKVIEHLNKKQKVTTGSLDAVEMLMLSHAKTMKTFSPRRQAIAKQQISNIIGNLGIDQIEENEKNQDSHPTNQHVDAVNYNANTDHVIHHQNVYPTSDQHVAYPTQNSDAINLSIENRTQNYTNLDNYSW